MVLRDCALHSSSSDNQSVWRDPGPCPDRHRAGYSGSAPGWHVALSHRHLPLPRQRLPTGDCGHRRNRHNAYQQVRALPLLHHSYADWLDRLGSDRVSVDRALLWRLGLLEPGDFTSPYLTKMVPGTICENHSQIGSQNHFWYILFTQLRCSNPTARPSMILPGSIQPQSIADVQHNG